VGFGLGLERFLMVVKATAGEAAPPRRGFQGIALGGAARARLIPLLAALRNIGSLPAFMDFGDRKLPAQFKIADRNNARYALILGDDELAGGEIVVRDLVTRDERRLAFGDDLEATARVLVEREA
jgi:histidyl-tRNA synthetase